jgi:ATP-binding cassette subfamily F protein 3
MPSKDVLKEAIKAFDGTAIIVSHDREFLDGLVSKVYEFGGGKVREHLGGIYDWLRASSGIQAVDGNVTIEEALNKKVQKDNVPAKPSPAVEKSGEELFAEHKEKQKKLRKAERAVEESEKKIAAMEQRVEELDQLLCDPKNASNMGLVTEYTSTKQTLDAENDRWLELSEKLDRLKKE